MKHYNAVQYWNERKDPCSKSIDELTPYHLKFLKEQLKGCKTILDFGPGYGRLFSAYEGIKKVIGIDVTNQHKNELERNAKKYGFEFELIINSKDFTTLNFLNKYFDAVVISEVLLHQTPKNVVNIMRELERISEKVIVITYMNHKQEYDKIGDYNPDHRYCFNYDYMSICKNNNWNFRNAEKIKNQIMFVYSRYFKFNYEGNEIKFLFDKTNFYMSRIIQRNKTFYEEKYLRYLKDNKIITKESNVIDVGSYIGNHAIYFSKIIGCKMLFCFEPTLSSYKTLIDNLNINKAHNYYKVLCYNFGISSKYGFIELYKYDTENPGANQYKYCDEYKDIECKSLDVLFKETEKIHFIKIDVENMELEVLKGAKELISKFNPIIMIEVGKINIDKMKEWIKENKYQKIGLDVFNKNTWLLKNKENI